MKPYPFPGNTPGLNIEYHRTREGPNFFMCYYKQSAVLRQDPKDAWRILGVAKFTDSGKELKAWCLEMDETYGLNAGDEANSEAVSGRADTSFASEAQIEEEPNDNTKMVT